MRNVMITTIGEDYVLAAQAKGLPSRRVVFTYAARNALLPQLQGFGLALGFVVSGAIIMEIVFSYPGIGLLLLNAVTSDDFPLMQAIFLVITFAVLLANLIVDMVHRLHRSAGPGAGGGRMTAASCRSAPTRPRVAESRPTTGRWRRLPRKAKAGAILLGFFVLAGIIGPFVTPYDPSFQNPSLSAVAAGAERRAPARHHPERPGRAVPAARRASGSPWSWRSSSASSPPCCRSSSG